METWKIHSRKTGFRICIYKEKEWKIGGEIKCGGVLIDDRLYEND